MYFEYNIQNYNKTHILSNPGTPEKHIVSTLDEDSKMAIEKTRKDGKNYWSSLISEVVNRKPKIEPEKRHYTQRGIAYETQNARRSVKYQLGEPLAGIYLTQREAECVMQMLKGKTMNETGDALQLSPRTVEYYLSKVKQKLKCHKKREMINLVSKTEFAKNFQRDPFNQDKD